MWSRSNCDKKVFWHITSNVAEDGVLRSGIASSDDGQLGSGVYCIEFGDYDVIDSVIELMESRGLSVSDLICVEFNYSGCYDFVKKELLVNSNEGWCRIGNDIALENIIRVISVEDLYNE